LYTTIDTFTVSEYQRECKITKLYWNTVKIQVQFLVKVKSQGLLNEEKNQSAGYIDVVV